MGIGGSKKEGAEAEEPLLAQDGGENRDEGVVTVISAAEAALARAERSIAGERPQNGIAHSTAVPDEPLQAAPPPQPAALISRSERDAERQKRGEADHSITGLLLYALSTLFMSAMMILVKQLGRWNISVFIVLLIRSFTVLTCALINLARDGTNPFGNRRALLVLRGFLGFGGNGGYFWTVTLLPLNDAIVLTFLAPMWVAILSPALLKERPGKFTYVAIPLCLLGVYLIAEAKTGDLGTQHIRTIGIVVAIFQAFFSGTAKMCVRELRSTEAPNVIVFYLAFISTLGALTGVVVQGLFFQDRAGGKLVPPTHFKEIFTCLLVGLLGYGAQISLTYGLRSAKAAPAIATSYLSVVWGVLAGYFVFKEVPTAYSVLGAVLIIGCTLALGLFENKKEHTPIVPPEQHALLGHHSLDEETGRS